MTDRPDPDVLLDRLADHDAGLPVDPRALADPRARAVLEALAATRSELGALPPVPVPPEIAARWSTALTEARVDRSSSPTGPGNGTRPPSEAMPGPDGRMPGTATGHADSPGLQAFSGAPAGGAETSPVPGRPADTAPRPRRPGRPEPSDPRRRTGSSGPGRGRRRRTPRPSVVVGLLLAAVLVVAGLAAARTRPPSITSAQLGGIVRAAIGVQQAGELADPVRRAACLRSVDPSGPAPDAPLAGGRSVVFEGRPAVVLLLVTGKLGVFRAVVVDPGCGAGGGTLMADIRVGR